ncbi:MAG: response regulator [Proteobacteria bacterium]|nr:response regulator [Pseudomonadota bacterium]
MRNEETVILVVDDEFDILNLLDFNLRKAGYRVLQAEDGPEALTIAESRLPNLILLDIMLPNMEGTEVLKRLKASKGTESIPVIMLTAKGEEIDKIVGFELGAEDYITKPFSPRELVLRVKAVLKRSAEAGEASASPGATASAAVDETVVEFKELSVDPSRHKVFVAGTEVTLSAKEFGLLTELMASKGRVLSRDHLLDRVWGVDCFVTPRTIDTHIRRLRSKLLGAGDYVETVRGVGYRFVETL